MWVVAWHRDNACLDDPVPLLNVLNCACETTSDLVREVSIVFTLRSADMALAILGPFLASACLACFLHDIEL